MQAGAYGFSYDAVNRLIGADFTQHNGTAYVDNTAVNFDMMTGDGTPGSAYDENGNIKKLQQWGLKLNTSPQIDNMFYSYYTNSNKLSAVAETGTGTTDHKLGDFTDKNTVGNDYGYDKNGNLLSDLNKRINGVTIEECNLLGL
ncbi:MAG: repeat-associated core domain protein [Chitinophagaceae bacterium]|nr:repeat-associated core domain protein [Chitinophagaceae bacterium]